MDPSLLYALAKDLVRWLARKDANRLLLKIDANLLGSSTQITVTARCAADARPVTVLSCHAERYEHAFDSCGDPTPVRTRLISFQPSGAITVRPGGPPRRWEARVLNEHLRREAREGDRVATVHAYGKRAPEILGLQERLESKTRQPGGTRIKRLLQALEPPQGVRVRAVLTTVDNLRLITPAVLVPRPAPLMERLGLLRS